MPGDLREKLRPIASELVKFLVVGGFCFVLDIALAYAFRFKVGLGPTTSKTLSTLIATGVSYAGNRLWSFSHRVDASAGQGRDITRYGVINLVGLVITLVPVDVAHYVLSETSPFAFNVTQVGGTIVATFFRFWAYRRYVFAHDPALEGTALV